MMAHKVQMFAVKQQGVAALLVFILFLSKSMEHFGVSLKHYDGHEGLAWSNMVRESLYDVCTTAHRLDIMV